MAIKLDENLTINQVLELTKRGQSGTLKKAIQKAGLSLDDKFSAMRGTEFLKKLNEVGTEGNFTELTSVEVSLRELFNIDDEAGKFPFGDKKTFGAGGKARSKELNLVKADQARKAKLVELPSISEINKSIHTATQKLVAEGDRLVGINKGKQAVKFYEAAALLQVKHHTGLRTTDITNLTTGTPLPDAQYGTVVKGSDMLAQISNKGDRTNFRLSSMPMGILQHLAEVSGGSDSEKSVKIFKTGKGTLEKEINKAVNNVLKQNNLLIRDQDTGKTLKFTVGLLRKNVFDAIDEEQGAGVANRVLGHSTRGDVGLTHYKVTRTSRPKLDINTLAAEQFNSLYLNDIGQSSPQKVMASYKFGSKFFPIEPVVKFETPNPIKEAAQKTGLNLETKTIGVSNQIENIVEDNDKKIDRLETQVKKIQGLREQITENKTAKKNQVNEEMAKSHDDKVNKLKTKSRGNRLYELGLLLYATSQGKELFDSEGVGELIRDVAIDTASTAILGPTGGLAVVESLRPSPAFAAERTGAKNERPATQEELMRPIQKRELETVADDERAIQEQMNIRKMSEDFRSEAERKSQLSLGEQMQLLQQGRQ